MACKLWNYQKIFIAIYIALTYIRIYKNLHRSVLIMGYSIAEVVEKTNLTAYTLRYYEKEGLLPSVQRSDSGNRDFSESDLEWLEHICCLKSTGMPIKKIKEYIDWCMKGDETVELRRQMFINHRKEVLKQIEELQKNLQKLDCKINFYESACKANVSNK